MSHYRVVEVCAGAGGQSLGLELAGFEHKLSVELDADACATLKHNRPHWKIAQGDVASPDVWNPAEYAGTDLLAGGVPCPPFTIAVRLCAWTDQRAAPVAVLSSDWQAPSRGLPPARLSHPGSRSAVSVVAGDGSYQ